MSEDIYKKFRLNEDTNEDLTSSQGYRKITYRTSTDIQETGRINDSKYFSSLSKNTDVFQRIRPMIQNIPNEVLTERLLYFMNVFTDALSNIQKVSNFLTPMRLEIDDDSLFLEWVFKDFRSGFTISTDESEAMWFIITNKDLEELSVTGDLKVEDYKPVIIKILKYALENT